MDIKKKKLVGKSERCGWKNWWEGWGDGKLDKFGGGEVMEEVEVEELVVWFVVPPLSDSLSVFFFSLGVSRSRRPNISSEYFNTGRR
jgi:hypothetical protein